MSDSQREVRAIVRNVYVCYFLSGALGLIYQVLWLRKLLLVFGSTVHAVSTVLTVFFGGLALGSWWFGKRIDRYEGKGLQWYAGLEAAVGAYAFLTPVVFTAIQHIYIPIYRVSGFSPNVLVMASFVCAAVILLPPTFLMGGTFPVLSRFLIRTTEERGMKIAGLYGINTAGAMAGTLLVYYFGLPVLGFFRTLLCAGVLNLGIGALCLTFDRHLESLGFQTSSRHPAAPSPAAESDESGGSLGWLLWAFGLSGFSAMVYEVAWTRALSLVLGSSIYAFCTMLATFLGGIAIGSACARRDLNRAPATIGRFIRIEVLLGLYGLFSVPFFSGMPDLFVKLWPITSNGSFSGFALLQFIISALAMATPTVLMGVLFPLVTDLVTRRFAQLGQRLGSAYAINTFGGIVGSFLSGFVLIPVFGLPWAIVFAALINVIAGLVLYLRFGRGASMVRLGVASAALLVAVVVSKTMAIPTWQRNAFAAGVYLNPASYRNISVAQGNANVKTLFYRDSLNATVSVHQQGDMIFLKVGGKTDASNGLDMGTQVLAAHLPLLLHPEAKRVLVIGLGSGVTLGNAGRYPVTTLDCAEIDPAVIEGARFFKKYNYNIHEDPRTKIFPVDGRNFLLASAQHYDVIISEPSNPWMTGIAYLFTKEFYQLAKRRFAPGGVMCQWVQLYRIFPEDVKLVLKTFHSEFPYVSVWSAISGDLLLVGSMEPQQLDYQRLAERMREPKIHESLKMAQVERPDVLLQLYWMGNKEVEELTANVPWVHEDDQPSLEFSAPKALYVDSTLATNLEGLHKFQSTPDAIARGYPAEGQDAQFYLALAAMWRARLVESKTQDALEHAVTADPSLLDAWLQLGEEYARTRQYFKAEEALTKAMALDPGNARPYQLLGRLNWQQKRLTEAQAFYQRAAGVRAPNGPDAEEIGRCFLEAHQFLWAAEYYRSAISQGPQVSRGFLLSYVNVLKELHLSAAQEQAIRLGVQQFPSEGVFLYSLGEFLISQGREQEAEPVFRKVVAVAPSSPEGYYGLGRIAMRNGRHEQAMRLLQRGLLFNPYDRKALVLLHQLQQEKT